MAKKETPLWRTVIEALLIAAAIHTLLFRPFYIPSSSMKPNLLIGDYIIINKFSYGYSKYSCYFHACPIEGRIFGRQAERGDVVVFANPRDDRAFVKRVIGLPGDRVQIKASHVFINGEEIPYAKTDDFIESKSEYLGGRFCRSANGDECHIDQYVNTLPEGKSFNVLNFNDSALLDNTQEFLVPVGHYFVMGDNRDDSDDSRGQVGMLPEERLIGKAKLIVFSSAGSSLFQFWKWRSDRFFQWVE